MNQITNDDDNCLENAVHDDIVGVVQPELIDENTYYELAEFFKIFADQTRLKIIHAISLHELCVCDIAELLGISQSAASHQLKMLRQFKLVKPRREGKMVFYSLTDNHVNDIFEEGLVHIRE